MLSSGHFSVTTAGALVLGGVAAVVLATVIALGGYGRGKASPPVVSARARASGAPSNATAPLGAGRTVGIAPGARGEYELDVSEATDAPNQP